MIEREGEGLGWRGANSKFGAAPLILRLVGTNHQTITASHTTKGRVHLVLPPPFWTQVNPKNISKAQIGPKRPRSQQCALCTPRLSRRIK